MSPYKKVKLKNGLRVILAPMAGTKTVTVMIMIGVGSRYETNREAGLSHFIEHMFFKGTKKRPTTLAISEELDAIGGEFNAFTSKDKTEYFAKVDAKHIDTALDVVSDIYLNSKIDAKEIEKEKGTIIQELNMYEDTPVRNITDIFESMLYSGTPLGREIVGTKKTIVSFKRKVFIDFMRRFYIAADTAVCVAGKFNEKKTLAKIKKYFGAMRTGKKLKVIPVRKDQEGPEIKLKFKKTDQTHLMLGTRAYDWNHKDRFALAILAIILGGGMSSRLFIEVREKQGLAYNIRTGGEAFEDGGYIATQAGVEHKNLEKTVTMILREYGKIAREKVNARELKKAKECIKGRIVMGLEASDEVATFYIDQEITRKKIMTQEELFSRIDKITEDDIMKVAQDVFRDNQLNLAVIGPQKDGKKFKKILKL